MGWITSTRRFPLIRGLGERVWSSSDSGLLIAIPFFVLLGEFLVRAGIAERTYRALDSWFLLAAGRPHPRQYQHCDDVLRHIRLIGRDGSDCWRPWRCRRPEKLGYDQRLFAGAIAAGGTLGIMIPPPPSINLIIYGFLTETSIPRLFLAGLIPGLLLALGFMVITAILCKLYPSLGGPSRSATWGERFSGLKHLVAVAAPVRRGDRLDLCRLGNAHGIGCDRCRHGRADRRRQSPGSPCRWSSIPLIGTVRTTAMVMFVIVGAPYFPELHPRRSRARAAS